MTLCLYFFNLFINNSNPETIKRAAENELNWGGSMKTKIEV